MKTDTLAIAQASQSKSFRAKNPHLFGGAAQDARELASHASLLPLPPLKKKGKRRKQMNKTEADFARLLDARVTRGEIVSWAYEEITLRWPDGLRYTPDFVVVHREGRMTLIEVKGGFAWPKDIVKFRAARDKWKDRFSFGFFQKVDGEWQETR